MIRWAGVDGPFGPLTLTETDGVITRLDWRRHDAGPACSDVLERACRQLAEYFAGERRDFDLPLDFGDGFQLAARHAMVAIPFGETRTYGDLARALGVPAQAIGQACGANPILILIPCHRVLGSAGLGGYSGQGGIETKVALLRHEGAAGLLI